MESGFLHYSKEVNIIHLITMLQEKNHMVVSSVQEKMFEKFIYLHDKKENIGEKTE